MRSRRFGIASASLATLIFVGSFSGTAIADTCPCNGNVNGGPMNVIDVAIILDCVSLGLCGACTVSSCDVDCDGAVDYVDAGVAACQFQEQTDCCNKPDGACTGAVSNAIPPCAVTLEALCGLFSGTFHGDRTVCEGANVIDIPAVSTWGALALSLSVLSAGTLVLRRRLRTVS